MNLYERRVWTFPREFSPFDLHRYLPTFGDDRIPVTEREDRLRQAAYDWLSMQEYKRRTRNDSAWN